MTAMNKPKGGRGHTVPYETKQMRVPVPLENQIQELMSRYRQWLSASGASLAIPAPPHLLDKGVDIFSLELVDKLEIEIARLNKVVDNLRKERDALALEVNSLHTRNGELNLELAELSGQTKAVDKLE